ncbi:MAG: sugar transferase [Phycisphaerae bacterium]|nr:sugar transferase [Phycisphaerae bacterium]
MAYEIAKRIFDIVASLFAILIALPLMIVILIAIRLGSPGPAIFRQQRAGKNGAPFTLLKFRTMRTDVDPFGPSPKSGQDQRLTGIGKVLREWSLDELPQLFNILSGRMSLVGPRPLYRSQMAEWDSTQRRRLEVKPGLTGLAQICGRAELTLEEKLALDVEYVDKRSFRLDLKILCMTLGQLVGRRNIYEKRYSRKQTTRNEG